MTKEEKELYRILLEDGYDKDFAQLCVDCMVSEERIIGEVVGFFEEIYFSRMAEIEEASDDMKDMVSYFIKTRLSEFCASILYSFDDYMAPGMNMLIGSDLEKTAFAIHGGTHFVIFDNEEDAPEENRTFHTISDYICFHDDVRERIENAINKFDWRSDKEKEKEEEEKANRGESTILSMDPYNVAVRWMNNNRSNENYDEVSRLVNQYYYGRCVHRELEEFLDKIGVKYEKKC
jgi:hypothetical protein